MTGPQAVPNVEGSTKKDGTKLICPVSLLLNEFNQPASGDDAPNVQLSPANVVTNAFPLPGGYWNCAGWFLNWLTKLTRFAASEDVTHGITL